MLSLNFLDLLWTFLCGHQPLQEVANLHTECDQPLQGQEKE